MKNHTFAVAILVVEMTRNITKIAAILQVIPSKTFDNFFRNDKCTVKSEFKDSKKYWWCTIGTWLRVVFYKLHVLTIWAAMRLFCQTVSLDDYDF